MLSSTLFVMCQNLGGKFHQLPFMDALAFLHEQQVELYIWLGNTRSLSGAHIKPICRLFCTPIKITQAENNSRFKKNSAQKRKNSPYRKVNLDNFLVTLYILIAKMVIFLLSSVTLYIFITRVVIKLNHTSILTRKKFKYS